MKLRLLLLGAIALGALQFTAVAGAMTPGQVKAFMRAQTSQAQLSRSLDRLSRADRHDVIKYGITPHRLVVTDGGVTATIPVGGAGLKAAKARAAVGRDPVIESSDPIATIASCGSWKHDFRARSYSWIGLWQFSFFSNHQWSACNGRIKSDNHQEHANTAIGWSFNGSSYGAGYGCIGCWMHGREVFGQFGFIRYAVNDTADLQAQVHANGGWWSWANITGP